MFGIRSAPVHAPRPPPLRDGADARQGPSLATRRPLPPVDRAAPRLMPWSPPGDSRRRRWRRHPSRHPGRRHRTADPRPPADPAAARSLSPLRDAAAPSRRRGPSSSSARQGQASPLAPRFRRPTPDVRGRTSPVHRQPVPATGRSMPAEMNAEVSPRRDWKSRDKAEGQSKARAGVWFDGSIGVEHFVVQLTQTR